MLEKVGILSFLCCAFFASVGCFVISFVLFIHAEWIGGILFLPMGFAMIGLMLLLFDAMKEND